MDERTQGALLLAVGGVALRPLLTGAGAVLVLLGLNALVRAFRAAAAPDEPHTPDEHLAAVHLDAVTDGTACAVPAVAGPVEAAAGSDIDGHAHHGGPAVAWLLVLPLLALLLIAPPPLGAFAAARQSTRPLISTQTSYPPLPDAVEGAIPLSMSEYVFRALYDQDRSLEGVRVRLTGFVTPSEDGDGYLLTRFTLNCCAADATAITVDVRGDTARPADTWLEVEGEWESRPGHDPTTPSTEPPILVAERVTPAQAPAQPYEY